MPNKRPEYYKEIDQRFESLENRQREFRISVDDILVHQTDQIKKMDQIHYLLAGTEYEAEKNGGMCGELKRIKCDINKNTIWRIRITAAVSAVASAIGFVLFKFGSIISTLKELVKPN